VLGRKRDSWLDSPLRCWPVNSVFGIFDCAFGDYGKLFIDG
jgi:hypothetical protein